MRKCRIVIKIVPILSGLIIKYWSVCLYLTVNYFRVFSKYLLKIETIFYINWRLLRLFIKIIYKLRLLIL